MVIINSFRYPESNIRHEQRDVRAILDKKDLGLGTLFVSESTLCWQEKDDIGFSIGYPDITLHAISKDQTVYPRECLFIVVDGKLVMPGDDQNNHHVNDESSDDDDEEENEVSELLLVPPEENANAVKNIYEALKICQELNPDPNDMDDDDNLYADAEDEGIEEEEGHYNLNERGAGDADIEDISRRMGENSVNINYAQNNRNNEDEEFQDAD